MPTITKLIESISSLFVKLLTQRKVSKSTQDGLLWVTMTIFLMTVSMFLVVIIFKVAFSLAN